MIEIFHKGGPIMWPLLLVSVVALTVVIERLVFIALEKKNRNPALVGDILTKVENGHVDEAARLGEGS
jgi:biopolymer transport protein ExbB